MASARRASDITAVHSVQSDVSPENFMAMWETVRDYGTYQG